MTSISSLLISSLKDRASPSAVQGRSWTANKLFTVRCTSSSVRPRRSTAALSKVKFTCISGASCYLGSPHHTAPSRQYPHKSADSYRSRHLRGFFTPDSFGLCSFSKSPFSLAISSACFSISSSSSQSEALNSLMTLDCFSFSDVYGYDVYSKGFALLDRSIYQLFLRTISIPP